jgi:hypothetical protein
MWRICWAPPVIVTSFPVTVCYVFECSVPLSLNVECTETAKILKIQCRRYIISSLFLSQIYMRYSIWERNFSILHLSVVKVYNILASITCFQTASNSITISKETLMQQYYAAVLLCNITEERINPRCMHRRVTVLALYLCVYITISARSFISKHKQVIIGFFVLFSLI